MKNIFNRFGKLRLALLVSFLAVGMTVLGQALPNQSKLSFSTQMFLDEMSGKITFDETPAPKIMAPDGSQVLPLPSGRLIVSPTKINGKSYISAFINVADESVFAQLEKLGVEIQCKFDKGLITTNIPVDKINDVAALDGVIKIDVATYMKPTTDLTRQATNVDDVLTLSQDARNAGLLQTYDGTGVIMGIIDTGIDYQHTAFKKSNGTSRVARVYSWNGSSVSDWTGSGAMPETDNSSEDHGTHTSSIAGGSSVTVSGTNVTVTTNHANATYGGMAPGTDLYLCGTRLVSTYSANAFQKMAQYAASVGKPLVVSNSWSETYGPRDGTSNVSSIINQYFGDSHPNNICLFASSNDAGAAAGGVTGGNYASGTSTQSRPFGTILRCWPLAEQYNYAYYGGGIMLDAWVRSTSATGIGLNLYCINKTTGAKVDSLKNVTARASWTPRNGNSSAFGYNGSFEIYFDQCQSYTSKHEVLLVMNASSLNTGSNYAIAAEVYPIGVSSSVVDMWANSPYCYCAGLPSGASTPGHTWTAGSDDASISTNATMPNVIAVGSYVTRDGDNSVGDISDFSSYEVEGQGPTGALLPWITAPGEVIISAYNHYNTNRDTDTYPVVVNSSSAPYGGISGTSMATPAAAGIVALWMQAATEFGHRLTHSEVKQIMKQTAIHDQWTDTRSNHTHFGNGKIDALGGIAYIQQRWGSTDPVITVDPEQLALFLMAAPGGTATVTVNVSSMHLTGNITASLTDPDGVFSIYPFSITMNQDGTITITYSPEALGSSTATITLTSPGAEPVVITITGTCAELDTYTSNTVTVPVHHTVAQVFAPYTIAQIDADTDYENGLKSISNTQVDVLAKGDSKVTAYRLRQSNTVNPWDSVAYALHQGNNYVPYAKSNNSFVQQGNTVAVTASNEGWVTLTDNVEVENATTWYAPVVVANGIISTGNTYGSPLKKSEIGTCGITIGHDVSKNFTDEATGSQYQIWTARVNFDCAVPALDNENYHYECYKIRAWRQWTPYVVGTGAQPQIITYMGEKTLNGGTTAQDSIGSQDFKFDASNEWVPDQWCFYTVAGTTPTFYGRFYYRLVANNAGNTLAGNGAGGGTGSGSGTPNPTPTGLHEFFIDKLIVDVMYVNPQGMTSRHPFDGVNIIVTRYNDGSTTTQKMIIK